MKELGSKQLVMEKQQILLMNKCFMKNYLINISVLLLIVIVSSCKQNITIKETSLTEINPLSYTDVIYKSERDTVLVSTFDGRIFEIIKNKNSNIKSLIIDINDEVYSLAYNHAKNLIYASTLNNGIVIINENKAQIEKTLTIDKNWLTSISYNQPNKILFASGYADKPYLWNVDDNYTLISTPDKFNSMQPSAISDDGVVFFDGNGVVGLWSIKDNSIIKISKLSGRISGVYSATRVLAISDKNLILKNINTDSVLFERKHPDWPIYVSSRDTTIKVPVSLALTDAVSTKNHIYSSSIDKSIRKWNVENGELIEDLLGHKATISSLSLSKDETQLVSVDLKGGIKFWNLKDN